MTRKIASVLLLLALVPFTFAYRQSEYHAGSAQAYVQDGDQHVC